MRKLTFVSLALLFAACGKPAADLNDDFSDLDQVDEKADAFSTKMKIVGSLEYGDTSATVYDSGTPRYRAFKFAGNAGDQVDVWVRSTDGDAVAWLLDDHFKVIARNDDGDDTTLDSHIAVTLPDSTSATHYIVFREYHNHKSHYTVALAATLGPNQFNGCNVDADCVAVPRVGCCNNGYNEAINVGQVDAYEMSFTCPEAHPVCPLYVVDDTRQPECNIQTGRCEMVNIEDIKCGGFIKNAHKCPDGYSCHFNNVPDLPGSCVANPTPADCRTQGCSTGDTCQLCWGHYSCVPQGAMC